MNAFITQVGTNLSTWAAGLLRPVDFSTLPEAIAEVAIGILLLIAGFVITRRGLRSPEHERLWTERRLQFTGIFGTITLLLAFLRYEGIPYASMQVVLLLVLIWALMSVVQLVLYRRFVLKPARIYWHEQKKHDAYLPKPKARTTR